ncbi:hypothetical protein ACWGNA_26935 [Brucella cytisi]|jgi:hypothetical protein
MNPFKQLDLASPVTDDNGMIEKDTHIVSRLAGISFAGCRDVKRTI